MQNSDDMKGIKMREMLTLELKEKTIQYTAGTLWACRCEQYVLPALPQQARPCVHLREFFFMTAGATAEVNIL